MPQLNGKIIAVVVAVIIIAILIYISVFTCAVDTVFGGTPQFTYSQYKSSSGSGIWKGAQAVGGICTANRAWVLLQQNNNAVFSNIYSTIRTGYAAANPTASASILSSMPANVELTGVTPAVGGLQVTWKSGSSIGTMLLVKMNDTFYQKV